MYMTSLEEPWKRIAAPGGYFMAPVGEEYMGDVMNVLFANGWIAGRRWNRIHLLRIVRHPYARGNLHHRPNKCRLLPQHSGRRTDHIGESVKTLNRLIDANLALKD